MSGLATSLSDALTPEPITSADVSLLKEGVDPNIDAMLGLDPTPNKNIIVLSVTDERIISTIGVEEPDGRFIGGFRGHDVPLVAAAIDEPEDRRFVLVERPATANGEPPRARRLVALGAFQTCGNVHFVDLNGPDSVTDEASSALAKRSTRRRTVLYE